VAKQTFNVVVPELWLGSLIKSNNNVTVCYCFSATGSDKQGELGV